MCGFVGFTGTDEQSELVLTAMMNRIIHRGPDMGGQHIVDNVALGFRRLSILDLSEAGAQPMSSDDGKVTIVFNGEIYNFQELRAELEAPSTATLIPKSWYTVTRSGARTWSTVCAACTRS